MKREQETNKYITQQIVVYKTTKKLLELNEKLKIANVENYAHIHADGDMNENGRKQRSCIGMKLQDYSKKGNTIIVTANISPEEACVNRGEKVFEFEQMKIFGEPDKNGNSKVTKLTIKRNTIGSDGKVRKLPWYIQIENGVGIKIKSQTGGSIMKSGSYQKGNMVFINLSDIDFYKLFYRTVRYVHVWELLVGNFLLNEGRTLREEQVAAWLASQGA